MTKLRVQIICLPILMMFLFSLSQNAVAAAVIQNVVLEKDNLTYPIDNKTRHRYQADGEGYVPASTTCQGDVSYPKIEGVKGAKKINAQIARLVKISDYQCKQGLVEAIFRHDVSYNDHNLLSIKFFEEIRDYYDGGSCHGETFQRTFDTSTGNRIMLHEVIQPEKIEDLKQYIADYLTDPSHGDGANTMPEHLSYDELKKLKKEILEDLGAGHFYNQIDKLCKNTLYSTPL